MNKRIKKKHKTFSFTSLNTEIVSTRIAHDYLGIYEVIGKGYKTPDWRCPIRYRTTLKYYHLNKRHTYLGSSHRKYF